MTDENPKTLEAVDIRDIMAVLPHRYPFLLIDRVIDIDGDESAIGVKNVTANEPHFTGHFPGNPIMPGVLLVEGMAQTAATICVRAQSGGSKLVYFMTIDNARFRKPVVPGDCVHFHVQKTKRRGNIWKFRCEARVDDTKVAEAEIGAMMVDADSEAE